MSIYPTNPRSWAQLDALTVDARRAYLDGRDAAAHRAASLSASAAADNAAPCCPILGPRGVLRYLRSPDRDAELAAYFYPAHNTNGSASSSSENNAKAIVVAVHGHGAYWQFEFLRMAGVGRAHVYEGSWVEALNRQGYSVCGVDNTGAGRSSGKFGLVERAEDLRDDVLALVKALKGLGGGSSGGNAAGVSASAAPVGKRGAAAAAASATLAAGCFGPALAGIPGFSSTLPLFLLGPSLGGCVSVQAALAAEARLAAASSSSQAAALPFAGVVLLAPLLGLEGAASRGWNPLLRRAALVLDSLPWTREWPVAAQEPNVMFPEQQLDFDSDGATYHYPCRVRTAVQLLRACAGVLPLPAAPAPASGSSAASVAAASEHDRRERQAQRAGQPLREAAKRLRAPLLAFHSARDTLCDCSATELFVEAAREGHAQRAASGGASAKAAAAAADGGAKLRRCDHLWHSVLREDSAGELLREAVAWMDARLPGGGGGGKRAKHNNSGGGVAAAAVAAPGARATVTLSATAGPKVAAPAAPAAAPKTRAKRSGGRAAAR
jgi:alpha-beta hydrolase superfamily lysophospholipase